MAQLYFYYSAMNAGKSTSLLQSSYNYQERGMRTLIFTTSIDDRCIHGRINSRIGLSSPAEMFTDKTNMFNVISGYHHNKEVHCVLIDECHFLNRKQVCDLSKVVDKLNIPVLCYGLRTDFRADLFSGSLWLLAWADKLVELKTICYCGKKANRVLRINKEGKAMKEGKQIVIGGNDSYVSVCRKHFTETLELSLSVPGIKNI